jgi:hypothetical protein
MFKHIDPESIAVNVVLWTMIGSHVVVFVVWTVCKTIQEVKRCINETK